MRKFWKNCVMIRHCIEFHSNLWKTNIQQVVGGCAPERVFRDRPGSLPIVYIFNLRYVFFRILEQ
jgi:hypothetical protein